MKCHQDFSGYSDGKKSALDAGDLGSVSLLGRSSGEGNGTSLRCSYLGDSMDRPWGHEEKDPAE